jgi:hypothetical protein
LTDTDPDAFDLTWRYTQDGHDYTMSFQQALEWQRRLAEAEANRDRYRAAAARDMAGAGLSQRAIGDALGISHQRVGQILVEANRPGHVSRRVS